MPTLPDKTALGGPSSFRTGRATPSASDLTADVSGSEASNIALAKGFEGMAKGVGAIAEEELKQQDALDLIKANASHSLAMNDIKNSFDTDPDYPTYRPRFAEGATQATADAASGIRNAKLRERWIGHANERNVGYLDSVVDRGTRLEKDAKEIEVENTVKAYRGVYANAKDDTARVRALSDMNDTITAAQRTGLLDAKRGEHLRERYTDETLRDDAERRLLGGDSVSVLRDLGALPRTGPAEPGTGRLSEDGLAFLKRIEGSADNGWDVKQFSGPYGVRRGRDERLTPEQAEIRLKAETEDVARYIRDNVKAPLTQAQTDALISFGYNLGTGAIGKLLPDINAGDTEAVAARMRSYNKAQGPDGQLRELPGLTSRRVQESEMYSGNAPSSRYSRMSFNTRHALITNARIAMSADTQQDLKDSYQQILDTGEAETDAQGMTALDKARLFLKPNQIKKAELALDEARLMHEAITPLRDMDEQAAVAHLRKFQNPKETGERAAVSRKVSNAAEAAWAEIQKQRLTDPAEVVDPATNVRTKKAGKTVRADEVTGAYDMIKRRFPGVALKETVAGGYEIQDPPDLTPEGLAETWKARRALIDARIEAQARLGVPKYNRKPITKSEADDILDMPQDVNSLTKQEYRLRLDAAADRAQAKYGKEMGPIVLEAALTMRKPGDDDHKTEAQRIVRRLSNGEKVSGSDIRRLNELQDIERRNRLYDYPRPPDDLPAAPQDRMYDYPRAPSAQPASPAPARAPSVPTDTRPTLPSGPQAAPAEPRRTQRGYFNKQPKANPFDEGDKLGPPR